MTATPLPDHSAQPDPSAKPLIAIAGASGFVGSQLRRALQSDFRLRGLTRSASVSNLTGEDRSTDWVHCDLFSLPQVEEALRGASIAIYLVHSMMPSSRLVQAHFRDLDLLLADNFGRAARSAGLSQIIYLGGLLPDSTDNLSPHLQSRREVEEVLRQSGVPVTVLRAGLIVGPGGSSTRMLIKLVGRLPVMILPKWTQSLTQSIDVRDVIEAFQFVLRESELTGGTYDLAGHPLMTYEQMIHSTGEVMGRRSRAIKLPVNCIRLSRLWVQMISGVSGQLVNPLLESLTYDLQAKPNPILRRLEEQGTVPFASSIQSALDDTGQPATHPRKAAHQMDRKIIRRAKRVRSVQRLPLPEGWDAEAVIEAYGDWLTKAFHNLIRVNKTDAGILLFRFPFGRLVLLELTPTPQSRKGTLRRAYYISGGLLSIQVDPPGRLEFRIVPQINRVVAALHGYAPRLPWWIYFWTQAKVHLWVMKAFSRHLAKINPKTTNR